MTFLLLFHSLKFGKTSLFCCNGYSHAIFTIIFYDSQVEQLRKSITTEKMKKRATWNKLATGVSWNRVNMVLDESN